MSETRHSAIGTQAYCSPPDDISRVHVTENDGNKFSWQYTQSHVTVVLTVNYIVISVERWCCRILSKSLSKTKGKNGAM